MRHLFPLLVAASLCACTGKAINYTTTDGYFSSPPSTRQLLRIELLMEYPQKPYVVVATASVKEHKPGWSDPTVHDAIDKIREVTHEAKGDAFVVRNTRSENRIVTVEGEIIRYAPPAQ